MNRYADFWQVTREALIYACRSLGLPCDETQRLELMREYLRLAVYPDTRAGLEALASRRLAILTNGTPEMLDAVVTHAGLKPAFAALLSVDQVKTYKPNPIVYQLAADSLNLEKNQIGFVSSNYWDAAGAAAFGFPAFWLNRAGAAPDELGTSPAAVVTRLDELAALPWLR
jgi:2-haloacid dehalogenase